MTKVILLEELKKFTEIAIKDIIMPNVPNVTTNNQTPTYSISSSLTELISGEKLSSAFAKIARAIKSLIDHLNNKNNPHEVTREQLDAAAKEHTHSSTDIIAGILSVARGGTGVQSYAALKSNLEIDSIKNTMNNLIHSLPKYETDLINNKNITTATFVYSDIFDSFSGKPLIDEVGFGVDFGGETKDLDRRIVSASSIKIYGGASGSKRVWCVGKGRAKWSYSIDNGNTWIELCNSIDKDYGSQTNTYTGNEGFDVIFDNSAKAVFDANMYGRVVLFKLSFVDGAKRYPVAWGESTSSYPWSLTMPSAWVLSFIESDL